MKKNTGKVYLIGAGPGHPDYLSLKGARILSSCDVIVYDALIDPAFRSLYPKKAKRIYVGKRRGNHSISQEEINHILFQEAIAGNIVARLKGGDPFLFGRGGEEALFLSEQEIPFEVIPGVSSFLAAGAAGNIPPTHRGVSDSVLLLNGHKLNHDWEMLAGFKGTIVFFMGLHNLEKIVLSLRCAGARANLPIAIVQNVTTNSHTIKSNLTDILDAVGGIGPGPALIYVGDTVEVLERRMASESIRRRSH